MGKKEDSEFWAGWNEALEAIEIRTKALYLELGPMHHREKEIAQDTLFDVTNQIKELKEVSVFTLLTSNK